MIIAANKLNEVIEKLRAERDAHLAKAWREDGFPVWEEHTKAEEIDYVLDILLCEKDKLIKAGMIAHLSH